jgi:hypothetical protein
MRTESMIFGLASLTAFLLLLGLSVLMPMP